MTGLRILVGKELAEQVRTMRLPVVAIVFLFVGLSSPLLARYTPDLVAAMAGDQIPVPLPPATTASAVDQFIKNLLQFGGLAGILLAMGIIAAEKERGTAALLLTTPASRGAFVAAKAAALAVTLAVATGLAVAAAWVYTTILFEPLPLTGWLLAGSLAWLMLAAYTAVTFLASAIAPSPVAAGALGFGAFLVLSVVSALPVIGDWTPSGLATPARALALATGESVDPGPLVATVALVVGAVALAWLAFRSREL